jgi:Na+(H+)/acetate symporter ActP
MSILIVLSIVILLLSLLFLGLSIAMILRKYTVRGTIISIFFLILAVKYLVFLYYEFSGIPVNITIFISGDLVMIIALLGFMITR